MPFNLEDVFYIYQKGMYFAQEAIKGVNLEINDGEMLGVMGVAGSGKSTLLQLLNALLKAERGIVFYNENNLAKMKRKELVGLRREIGMVFQYPEQQIFADKVYDEIAFGPRNMNLDPSKVEHRVREAMSQVDLNFNEYSQRPTTALSSGEKRRIAIASILALKPKHLLLDEPTAGLDLQGRQAIFACLRKINQQYNTTVVMVTHNFSHLLCMCQRLIIIDHGTIALDTTIDKLLDNYDKIKNLGIDLPPHLEVTYHLLQRGWNLETSNLSVSAIAQQIAKQLKVDKRQL
ncbi:MAG: ATP-binding cassette domain-containing protein [Syntrophomonadaceae bacterium]|jgi:energy-coupling factor transport system ATP-binding protein